MENHSQGKRLRRFIIDIWVHTPFVKMLVLLAVLWLVFSGGVYLAEKDIVESTIDTYGEALYWGVAAFSTAGIADAPLSSAAQFVGGLWIIIGSTLFFGTIVATVTTYFMRPMQRPHKKIIETIEYNLEQLDELTLEELELLNETVDSLIEHVEEIKKRQAVEGETPP